MFTEQKFVELRNKYFQHVVDSTQIDGRFPLLKEFKNWYVGISDNLDAMFNQHLKKAAYVVEHFFYQNILTLGEAKKMKEKLFKIGFVDCFKEKENLIAPEDLKASSTYVCIFKFR